MRNIKVDNEDNIIFDIERWHKQITNYQDVKLENAIDNLNIEIDYTEDEYGLQLQHRSHIRLRPVYA